MLRHVDLCSGIGGFSLGFEWAELSKPVLFCDIEPWSRKILTKHWPDVPIAEDVKELANDPDGLVPDCDILTAGYPCQSFSLAGKRRGTEDDRHIWPFIFSIIQSKRPTWCVFENVYGHVTLGLDQVLSDLERESYATRPFIVPACATDAPHRRDRLWIICRNVADTDNARDRTPECGTDEVWKKVKQGQEKQSQLKFSGSSKDIAKNNDPNTDSKRSHRKKKHEFRKTQPTDRKERVTRPFCEVLAFQGNSTNWKPTDVGNTQNERCEEWSDVKREGSENKQEQRLGVRGESSGSSEDVADTNSKLRETQHQRSVLGKQNTKGSARGHSDEGLQGNWQWQPEPPVGRVANGIPRRVDRLRGLGNAIVPQIAMRIGQTIKATYDA
jgi:DNA (cytosine-5)-methyltransferase 1